MWTLTRAERMTIMIIISILIINWGCFSSRLHYCPRLGLLVHALGSPEQECNLHGLPSPASRCRRGNLYKNNYSYHQRYYYHYYHCLHEGRSGVPIHAKSPTPSLNKLRPCFDFADIMLWNGKLQKQLTRSRAIG